MNAIGSTILVAVSDSPAAFRAAEVAIDLADRLGAALHAVTVIAEGEVEKHLGGADAADLSRRREMAADTALRHVAALGAAAGIQVVGDRRKGRIAAQILAQAEAINADVIVMARVDRPGHAIAYIGSQTMRVLEFTRVPVLVVPMHRGP